MERVISDEEKIRKAIEISQRRNRNTYSTYVENKENVSNKKKYKLFKRMIIQIIICLLIYGMFYLVSNNNYIFSNEILSKTHEILSYDINFFKLYEKSRDNINSLINKWKEQNNKEINNEESNSEVNIENNNSEMKEEKKKETSKTQMEKDVQFIKEKYKFVKPLNGKITSNFGTREVLINGMTADHKGIDISAKQGTKIKAAIDGQVEEASKNSQYGKFIKIKNEDVLTVYAHCKKIKVSKGNKVKKGDVIATVGATGVATGPHLHFEIRLDNRYINPEFIIQF